MKNNSFETIDILSVINLLFYDCVKGAFYAPHFSVFYLNIGPHSFGTIAHS